MNNTHTQFSFLNQTCELAAQELLKSTRYGDALTKNMQKNTVHACCAILMPACYTPLDQYVMMESIYRVQHDFSLSDMTDLYQEKLKDQFFTDMSHHLNQNRGVFYKDPTVFHDFKANLPHGKMPPHIASTVWRKSLNQAMEQHAITPEYDDQTLLSALFLQKRIEINSPSVLFRIHATDNKLIASGPLFDRHIDYFQDNHNTISQHTVPLASTSPDIYQGIIWKNIPDEKYYVIS
jgi:hypothetical protein